MSGWWCDGEETHAVADEATARRLAEDRFHRLLEDCDRGEHHWEYLERVAWGVRETRGEVVTWHERCDCAASDLAHSYHGCGAFEASDIRPGDEFEVASLVTVKDLDAMPEGTERVEELACHYAGPGFLLWWEDGEWVLTLDDGVRHSIPGTWHVEPWRRVRELMGGGQ